MWQLTFAAVPDTVKEMEDALRLDERVIRWVVLKRKKNEPLPSSYRIARAAESSEPDLFVGK